MDENISYLKIWQNKATEKFLDTNLETGLIPTISKPTRVMYMTCALIDNIYLYVPTNNMNYANKIFMSDMSDHFQCMP